ncbi:unnamed protein product, partial [Arabidopsis halleri]
KKLLPVATLKQMFSALVLWFLRLLRVDMPFIFPSKKKIILLDWVRRLSDNRKLLDTGDSRLLKGSYDNSDMKRLIHHALLYSLNNPIHRPNMK